MEPVPGKPVDTVPTHQVPSPPDPGGVGRALCDTDPPVVRRGLLEQLSGTEELVVLQSGRFGRATPLLRSWLDTLADSDVATASVLDPGSDISDHAYWARLHGMLSGRSASGDVAEVGADPFDAVLCSLAAHDVPVVVVLDDLHLVRDPTSRVEDLLRHAPPSGVRIIVTTRVADEWSGPVARQPGRKYLSSVTLNLVAEDVAALLRHLGLQYDVRTPDPPLQSSAARGRTSHPRTDPTGRRDTPP